MILRGYYGAKEFCHPGPLYTEPKAQTEEEETSEDERKSPTYRVASLRTTLSSANRDYRKEERHDIKGSLAEHPNKKDKYRGSSMGAWWKSNSGGNCHLRIKCPQLMF